MTDQLLELAGVSATAPGKRSLARERGWLQEFNLATFVAFRKNGQHQWKVVSDTDDEIPFHEVLFQNLALRTAEDTRNPLVETRSCGGLALMHLWLNQSQIPEAWKREESIVFTGITIVRSYDRNKTGVEHNISIFFDQKKGRWYTSLLLIGQNLFSREAIFRLEKK